MANPVNTLPNTHLTQEGFDPQSEQEMRFRYEEERCRMIEINTVFLSCTPLQRMKSVHLDLQSRNLEKMPIAGDNDPVVAKGD